MRKRTAWTVAGLAAIALTASGCGGSSTTKTTGTTGKAATGKVGVILPDSATSPRWEANDRPHLNITSQSCRLLKVLLRYSHQLYLAFFL